jgi:TusA-related sulfurtransferase
MTTRRLDITGPVSPYCILSVQRKAKALLPSDELIMTCKTIPAATTFIPRIARDEGLTLNSCQISPGLWEITLKKQHSRNPAGPDP